METGKNLGFFAGAAAALEAVPAGGLILGIAAFEYVRRQLSDRKEA